MKNNFKVTKKQQEAFLKKLLTTNRKAVIRALMIIYDNQTTDEQRAHSVRYNNSIGFTGVDGRILSSFVLFYKKNGFLTHKQLNVLYKKIPKYWKQILSVTNIEKLNYQILNN